MKVELDIQFKPGDVVWQKNLVTNEASQITIRRVTVYFFIEEDGRQSYSVMYHTGECILYNIPGKIEANNAFATKEEADACPRYNPGED